MQLAGKLCGLCQEQIVWAADAFGCADCGLIIHCECAKKIGGKCPKCGVDLSEDSSQSTEEKAQVLSQIAEIHSQLSFAYLIGKGLNGLVIAMWIAFLFRMMDLPAAGIFSFVAVFSIPLMYGAKQLLKGRISGLGWFKFGLFIFIFKPSYMSWMSSVDQSPAFNAFLDFHTNNGSSHG